MIFKSFLTVSKDIKLSHTVFSLPFMICLLVLRDLVSIALWKWVVLLSAAFFARSFAMSVNRILDEKIDLSNPRTNHRMLPEGRISRRAYMIWAFTFAIGFMFSSFLLGSTSGFLSLPLLIVLASYSLLKRFSVFCHFYLGICLALSPVAVEIATIQQVSSISLFLAGILVFWVAGFDIIYALQDEVFDKDNDLYSLPSRFGSKKSLAVSFLFFCISIGFMIALGFHQGLSHFYFVGVTICGLILCWEHWKMRPIWSNGTTPRIDAVFMNGNATVSIVYLFSVVSGKYF